MVDGVSRKDGGQAIGVDFDGYRSDNNKVWFTVDQLKKMAENS